MPTDTSFSSGFASGSNAIIGRDKNRLLQEQNQQEQRTQARAQADAGVELALKSLQDAAQKQSVAFFSELEEGGRQTIKDVHTKTAQTLWGSTQQMLEMGKQQGLYTDAEIANIKEQFRIGASLNNPAAESKLVAAGEAEGKVQPAVDAAQQKTDTSAKFVNFMHPETFEQESAREGSAKAAGLSQQGYIRDKRIVTGTPSDFNDKTEDRQNRKEIREAIENNNLVHVTGNRIKSLLSEQGATRGALAGIVNFAEGFRDQMRQLKGVEIFSTGDKVNSSVLATEDSGRLNAGIRSAMLNGKIDARVVSLSFMLAQVNNPDGRISDRDFATAERMIKGDSASIPSIISAIDEVMLLSDDRLNAKRDAFKEVGFGSDAVSSEEAPKIIDFNSLPE